MAHQPPARAQLDVTLVLSDPAEDGAWAAAGDESGGATTYVTADEELLTVPPLANSLSLVLREPGVASFVRYLSAAAPAGGRWDAALSFLVLGEGEGEGAA